MPTTEPPIEENQGEDAGTVDDATMLGDEDDDGGGDLDLGSALAPPDERGAQRQTDSPSFTRPARSKMSVSK